ncbi:FtsX-like permease family protein [Corynebacterium mendelii]|uniref:ABC transporter permease n=1 Tax=Corynebacterium mendelii TaxID=2765362 RepID=A0A939IY89_9CORY|nr:ABC transporter permease [Corynebacterium mendelii]MBN9644422.1 ABC transporter permease [Corynebacterium mendelii]
MGITLKLAVRDLKAHKKRLVAGILLFALPIALAIGAVSADSSDRTGTDPDYFPASSGLSEVWIDSSTCWVDDTDPVGCISPDNADLLDMPPEAAVEKVLPGTTLYLATPVSFSFTAGDIRGTREVLVVDSQTPGAPAEGEVFIGADAEPLGIAPGSPITLKAVMPSGISDGSDSDRLVPGPQQRRSGAGGETFVLPAGHPIEFPAVQATTAPGGDTHTWVISSQTVPDVFASLTHISQISPLNGVASMAYLAEFPAGTATGDGYRKEFAGTGVSVWHFDQVRDIPDQSLVALWWNSSHTMTEVLLIVLLLLLVVSLITPIFAVAARRQTRQMGLLAAQGATGSHLSKVLVWQGLVIGAIGSVAGIVLSWPVGYGLLVAFGDTDRIYRWTWDVALLVAVAGTMVGVASAVAPARFAAAADPVTSLAGGKAVATPTITPRLWFGPVLTVLASAGFIALQFGGVAADRPYNFLDLSTMLVPLIGIGLVASGRFMVLACGKFAGLLPLGPRLALRDAWRNNRRTGPAVSAVAGTTFCAAVLITLFIAESPGMFASQGPAGDKTATVSSWFDSHLIDGPSQSTKADIDTIASHLGAEESFSYFSPVEQGSDYPAWKPVSTRVIGSEEPIGSWSTVYPAMNHPVAVASAASAAAITSDPATRDTIAAALSDGKAVVFNRNLLQPDGTVTLALGYGPTTDYWTLDDTAVPGEPITGESITGGSIKGVKSSPGGYYSVDQDDPFFGTEPPLATTSVPAVWVAPPASDNPVQPEKNWGYRTGLVLITPHTAAATNIDIQWVGEMMLFDHRPGFIRQLKALSVADHNRALNLNLPDDSVMMVLVLSVPVSLAWLVACLAIALVLGLSAAEARRTLSLVSAVGGSPGTVRTFLAHEGLLVALMGSIPGAVAGIGVGAVLTHVYFSGSVTATALLVVGAGSLIIPLVAWITGLLFGRSIRTDIPALRAD